MDIEFQRSSDAAYFNRMTNHPSISPFIRDDTTQGEIDFTNVDMERCHCLKCLIAGKEAGFAILIDTGDGLELHSGLLPEFRGRVAIEAGKKLVRWAMSQTNCRKLTTWAWDNARHVLLVTKAIGFAEESRRDWPHTVNGKHVQQVLFTIDFDNLKTA